MVSAFAACKKWQDPQPVDDPRISSRRFCNDPEAVNYNWDFPGKPDNTLCFYPSDLFKGTFSFKDSIYSATNVFDSAGSQVTYLLQFLPLDKNRFVVIGFCPGDSLHFTAERVTYSAHADTTIQTSDTTFSYGQFFCRQLDTLTGTFTRSRTDSTGIYIDLKVVSDTGINYHRGTAIKQ
jgi:hypothetical protein